MRSPARQILVVVATLLVIAVNGLAGTTLLNGQTTGQVSDKFPVYFVPAGYVFSIWGIIYLGLLAYSVFQALPSQRDNRLLVRVAPLYLLSCAANIVWLFLWQFEILPATIAVMAVLLITLIAVYLMLGTGRRRVSAAETWLVRVPFSIYLGWITVATIANATDVLYWAKWSGWGVSPVTWAVIMLAVATAIFALMSLTRGDAAFVLVAVWAFAGIAVKQSATPAVAVAAWIAAGICALTLVAALPPVRRRLGLRTATG